MCLGSQYFFIKNGTLFKTQQKVEGLLQNVEIEMPSKKQLLYGMAEIFKALGDVRRLQILYMLQGREYPVSHIAKSISDVTRGAISQHLKVLKRTKLVKFRNEQTKHFYCLDPKPFQSVQRLISQLNKNDSWPEKAQNQIYQNIKKP